MPVEAESLPHTVQVFRPPKFTFMINAYKEKKLRATILMTRDTMYNILI